MSQPSNHQRPRPAAPSPKEWGLNLNDGLELRAARTLYVRANRLRNESMIAKSREQAQEAAVRFLLGVRQVAASINRPASALLFLGLNYLEQVTTPLFAFESNLIARVVLAKQRGEAA